MGQNAEQRRPHLDGRVFPWPRLRDKSVTRLPRTQLRKNIRQSTEFVVEKGTISSKDLNKFIRNHVRGDWGSALSGVDWGGADIPDWN